MQFRRIISVVIVICLMLVTFLPIFVFKFQQNIIRKEVKAMIKNGVPEEQRLRFIAEDLEADNENLTWMHDKEFRYRGEMYDILKREYVNGKLTYVCIHDVKESGLFCKLDEMLDMQMQHHSPLSNHSRQFVSFFQGFYIEQTPAFNFFIEFNVRLENTYDLLITSFLAMPETPPPQMCNA